MAITHKMVRDVAAALYERSLKSVPEDTKQALRCALAVETNETARNTLAQMIKSAKDTERAGFVMCGDSGIPVFMIKIGSKAVIEADIKTAVKDGFDAFIESKNPVILPHVTDPLTLEPKYTGKEVPLVSYDFVYGADYLELLCSPKGLGTGRWADLQVFSFPSIEDIQKYIFETAAATAAQMCPPVVIGVGIGGTIDYASKMAKDAMVRRIGTVNPDPALREMETAIFKAVNRTGIGPMGTGGDTTTLAVHIKTAAGHGFVPVAIAFNCWPNRRLSAKIHNDGAVEYF